MNPDLYVRALLMGLESEKVSVLLEDFYRLRLSVDHFNHSFTDQQKASLVRKLGNYKFEDQDDHSKDYVCEQQVNSRLGITLYSLL